MKIASIAVLCIVFLSSTSRVDAQSFDGIEKSRMKDILKIVKKRVKEHYYDPAFHGIDLDARFKQAEDKLDQATSTGQSIAIIAQVLIDFNDSHLFLIPPPTNVAVEYGWRMQASGDKVFVTQVKPGSDAEAKGLKRGDQILSIGGFKPSKKELWKVRYFYNGISKRDKLALIVQGPDETAPRQLDVKSEIKRQPQTITFTTYFKLFDDFYEPENDKHRFLIAGGVGVWRMPSFEFPPEEVDGMMGRFSNSRGLIMDLRGNGGGYVKTMEALTGFFFDKDMQIAEIVGRKKMDPSLARSRGAKAYNGKLIVLLDSESGSAAEIFARVIQLNKRGVVLGDVSSGSVMQSRHFQEQMGTMNVVPFAISVTNADLLMADGKSLEHIGVIPDEVIVPAASDIAAGRDPVLKRAFELQGGQISADDAAHLTKYYWKK
ncbi:MAG: PDZ domain-containing protein [Pyrinomonadaceae bacterium]|nr:PDZ domain-containing protein [Pyrinomonadaceae bacterium]